MPKQNRKTYTAAQVARMKGCGLSTVFRALKTPGGLVRLAGGGISAASVKRWKPKQELGRPKLPPGEKADRRLEVLFKKNQWDQLEGMRSPADEPYGACLKRRAGIK